MNLDIKLKFNFNKHYHQIKRYGHIKTRTRLFGYLNPYYRSAYNVSKCRK